ncbi:hypothetical protein CR513_27108, partial [Mucuna pruriens]
AFDCGEDWVILCVGWVPLMGENCGDGCLCQLALFSLLGIPSLLLFPSFCHLHISPSFLHCKMTGNSLITPIIVLLLLSAIDSPNNCGCCVLSLAQLEVVQACLA